MASLLLHDRLDGMGLDLVPTSENVAIWRGQIEGFYSKGNYLSPDFGPQAVIRPGTNMSQSHLEDSDLAQVFIPAAKLNEIEAHGDESGARETSVGRIEKCGSPQAKSGKRRLRRARMLRAPRSRRQIDNASFWCGVDQG